MTDQAKASRIAREGFDLWQAGRPDEAVALYRKALEIADPNHSRIGDYRGEFAVVLEVLGIVAESREQLHLAVKDQFRLEGDDRSSGVIVARYFLADHLVRHDLPHEALEVIAPSLCVESELEWILHLVQAEALYALNRKSDAAAAAARAIEKSPSAEKRIELHAWFEKMALLGDEDE